MPFYLKKGDTAPAFVVNLTEDVGTPGEAFRDLSTATSIVFNMREVGGAVKVNRGSMVKSAGTVGEVTYNWGTADVDTAGTYEAEAEVTDGGKKSTHPNDASFWEIIISEDIA